MNLVPVLSDAAPLLCLNLAICWFGLCGGLNVVVENMNRIIVHAVVLCIVVVY